MRLLTLPNPGSSLLALAHHLGLTSPTVSKMVDGLVLNNLVAAVVAAVAAVDLDW